MAGKKSQSDSGCSPISIFIRHLAIGSPRSRRAPAGKWQGKLTSDGHLAPEPVPVVTLRQPEAGRSASPTGPVGPHPRGHCRRRSWLQDGEGAPAVLLPVRGNPDNLPRWLGRSQVVNRRILLRPYGASNPPAPANLRTYHSN